ncbi:MAG: AAA family ATPase [Bacteroidales bacterium]|nr:AAA family ATPase [Bacteroidales bacterium]
MNVELKEIHPKNFRCFDDRTFSFGHNTIIRGTNGAGKSTLFDAFTFTLFGKDSSGRSDFGYKRRDPNGEIIHELEYGCEVVFDVDGEEKRFERVVIEKWVKPRMATEKVLSGNECAYYVDRVRCATKKEYDAAVAAIVGEDVFRIMTDVYFFMSQKDDFKKAMLLKMAYGTSDSNAADELLVKEVLSANPKFADFVKLINGVSIAEFNKNVGKKISAINAELAEIPTKIAAKKEATPPVDDWDGLQALIDENRAELAKIDQQISDENARKASANEAINKLRSEVSNKEYELLQRENAIRSEVYNSELATRKQLAQIDAEIASINATREQDCKRLTADRVMVDSLSKQLEQKREQFRTIKAGTYQYADHELYCPTCGHPYDRAKISEQKIAENQSQGRAIRADYDRYAQEVALLETNVGNADARIAELQSQKEAINFQPVDIDQMLANDVNCISIRQQIDGLKAQIAAPAAPQTPSTLIATKNEINGKIAVFLQKLGVKDTIERIEKQVAELEKKQAALNNELGELEYQQDEAKEFQKAKDRQLLGKVNRLFTIVTWDFVSEQYNGNDRIACNCYVDGMPYSEKNHAGQVNAGLDIINAIARTEGVHLPIFIDNAESVVEYIPTDSQKILLMVDASANELTFEV